MLRTLIRRQRLKPIRPMRPSRTRRRESDRHHPERGHEFGRTRACDDLPSYVVLAAALFLARPVS